MNKNEERTDEFKQITREVIGEIGRAFPALNLKLIDFGWQHIDRAYNNKMDIVYSIFDGLNFTFVWDFISYNRNTLEREFSKSIAASYIDYKKTTNDLETIIATHNGKVAPEKQTAPENDANAIDPEIESDIRARVDVIAREHPELGIEITKIFDGMNDIYLTFRFNAMGAAIKHNETIILTHRNTANLKYLVLSEITNHITYLENCEIEGAELGRGLKEKFYNPEHAPNYKKIADLLAEKGWGLLPGADFESEHGIYTFTACFRGRKEIQKAVYRKKVEDVVLKRYIDDEFGESTARKILKNYIKEFIKSCRGAENIHVGSVDFFNILKSGIRQWVHHYKFDYIELNFTTTNIDEYSYIQLEFKFDEFPFNDKLPGGKSKLACLLKEKVDEAFRKKWSKINTERATWHKLLKPKGTK